LGTDAVRWPWEVVFSGDGAPRYADSPWAFAVSLAGRFFSASDASWDPDPLSAAVAEAGKAGGALGVLAARVVRTWVAAGAATDAA
jgi:hypothetical protein